MLKGIRVLDLSRVIAGHTAPRSATSAPTSSSSNYLREELGLSGEKIDRLATAGVIALGDAA